VPADGPALFTIGHSNQALDDFLGLLQLHRIEAVADVRTVPRSRYVPHFSAGPLREALTGRGIAYIPMGRELGGRPEGDEFYDEHGHVLYGGLAATPAFRSGIDRVLAGTQTSRIALLCSEEDPSRCHRHLLIGRVLRARGVALSHIRRDGRVETEVELAIREADAGPPPGTGPQATLFDDTPGFDGGTGFDEETGFGDRSAQEGQWRSPRPISPEKTTPQLSAWLSNGAARHHDPGQSLRNSSTDCPGSWSRSPIGGVSQGWAWGVGQRPESGILFS